MGEPENLSKSADANDPQTADQVLRSVTQDLRTLQQDLVSQLSQDVGRLQTERSRLLNEIEKLQAQQQVLQSEHQVLLTQQQLAQQRAWAKQLAQTMAGHLYSMLAQRLSQSGGFDPSNPPNLPATGGSGYTSNADRVLLSLDETLNHALNSLQSDLSTYQSSLTQQLGRMQSMEQQGEALLEALVSRLSQQLQVDPASSQQIPSANPSADLGSSAREGFGLPPLTTPPSVSQTSGLNQSFSSAPSATNPVLREQLSGQRTDPANNPSAKTASAGQPSRPLGERDRPTPLSNSPPRSVRSYVSSSAMGQQSWLRPLAMLLGGFLVIAGVVLVGKLLTWVLQVFTGSAAASMAWLLPTLLVIIAVGLGYLLWRQAKLSTPLEPSTRERIEGSSFVRFRNLSPAQIGSIFVLLSTLALSLHNVVVGIIGGQTSIFGVLNLPASISLNSLSDSLLILWLRMVVVVPVMILIAKRLYSDARRDVRNFCLSTDRELQLTVIGSGAFLFLSQVCIYLAIAAVTPGVAVTILFMYPLITLPLVWVLFDEPPTRRRWLVMFMVLSGVVFTAYPKLAQATELSYQGIFLATLASLFFSLYLISMQQSFKKLHPVPVSVIQFVTIFVLANLMLLPFGVQEPPSNLLGLILGGIVLGTLTLIGYLLNNLAVKVMGAAGTSVLASSGPALTALLAYTITPSARTALQPVQIIGVLAVTLGVWIGSREKERPQGKAAKAAKKAVRASK